MENAIMLHNLSPEDLELLIKKTVEEVVKKSSKEIGDDLLSREQACKYLKIKNTTLWKWTKKGKIKAYGIGNRVLYKKEDLISSLVRIN